MALGETDDGWLGFFGSTSTDLSILGVVSDMAGFFIFESTDLAAASRLESMLGVLSAVEEMEAAWRLAAASVTETPVDFIFDPPNVGRGMMWCGFVRRVLCGRFFFLSGSVGFVAGKVIRRKIMKSFVIFAALLGGALATPPTSNVDVFKAGDVVNPG